MKRSARRCSLCQLPPIHERGFNLSEELRSSCTVSNSVSLASSQFSNARQSQHEHATLGDNIKSPGSTSRALGLVNRSRPHLSTNPHHRHQNRNVLRKRNNPHHKTQVMKSFHQDFFPGARSNFPPQSPDSLDKERRDEYERELALVRAGKRKECLRGNSVGRD